ncbi:MAG: DNA topoisomerase I, partial [Candidatus Omnitrophica bacterium]|nr:DNA topoisomerase I [Candidatus Omnitrophota bacterium]
MTARKAAPKPKGKKALVIVESPAKCRTIEKILGKGYTVQASMGHIIDLPKSKMGVDPANGFKPQYIVLAAKRKRLGELKKLIKDKARLFLACDPDREGEAISWHLANELGKDREVFRVTFQEITPAAVRNAFDHPTEVDMDKVHAQQARRILDRLVGYSLSPLLWKTVAKGLSAGRVQSVALRIIVDQERLIRAFVPREYWTVDAVFSKQNPPQERFVAALDSVNGVKSEIAARDEAGRIAGGIRQQTFAVTSVRKQEKRRQP